MEIVTNATEVPCGRGWRASTHQSDFTSCSSLWGRRLTLINVWSFVMDQSKSGPYVEGLKQDVHQLCSSMCEHGKAEHRAEQGSPGGGDQSGCQQR